MLELPTATIELDIPKIGKKPTKEQMDNLKQGAEAMAAHEDKMTLQTLHTQRLTMDGFHDEYQNDPQAVRKKTIFEELIMPDDAVSGEEKEESDRLRKIEQESASYMEEEEE